ncbi:MAG TPA: hypothetical protein VHC22_31285 [Pirellulales bacterium]|nr:hypothetical protein [Pirellulales bacterium]
MISYRFGYREPHRPGRKRQLLYFVVATAEGSLSEPVSSWVSGRARGVRSRGVQLKKPDGTKIDLPESDRQLYEFIDGEYREFDEKVSLRQLADFLRSQPDSLSIDALLSFAAAHPDK